MEEREFIDKYFEEKRRYDAGEIILEMAEIVKENRYLRQRNLELQSRIDEYNKDLDEMYNRTLGTTAAIINAAAAGCIQPPKKKKLDAGTKVKVVWKDCMMYGFKGIVVDSHKVDGKYEYEIEFDADNPWDNYIGVGIPPVGGKYNEEDLEVL